MSSVEPFTPEGIDPNSSYLATCINRVNTNWKTAFSTIPDVSSLTSQVNTNTTDITKLNTYTGINDTLVINVKSSPYNAIGDGTTDDTNAFKNAILSLPSNYGVLYIPRGRYFISDTILISNKNYLLIKSDNAEIIISQSDKQGFWLQDCYNIQFVDGLITFTTTSAVGNISKQALIYENTTATSRPTLKNIIIRGAFTYGVFIYKNQTSAGVALIQNLTIEGSNTCFYGLYLAIACEYFECANLKISNTSDVGLSIDGPNNVITGGHITGCRVGCRITGLLTSGINTDHGAITGCTFNHNFACGLFIRNLQFSFSITGNNIWANNGPGGLTEALNANARNYRYGVYFENCKGVTFIGNIVARNQSINIGYDGIVDCIINNNAFLADPPTTIFHIYEFGTGSITTNRNIQICNNTFNENLAPTFNTIDGRIYLGNNTNDSANNFTIYNNTGSTATNCLLMSVNSGNYTIGNADFYVIDNSVIYTTNGTDPAGQTANIYLLPHTTGTSFTIYFRGGVQNALQYIWLRYKTNNTGLAPYIPWPVSSSTSIVYFTASRCFRISNNLKKIQFTPFNNSLGNWCVIGDVL